MFKIEEFASRHKILSQSQTLDMDLREIGRHSHASSIIRLAPYRLADLHCSAATTLEHNCGRVLQAGLIIISQASLENGIALQQNF